MRYVDEFRAATPVRECAEQIARITHNPWTLMEVCGGQTHSIVKYGLDGLLPEGITLVHGPGCPVCVTPLELIEKAITIASRPGVIFCSFGDMLRVPGQSRDLLSVKALGGDVRIVYSPLDALKIARENPAKEVVFFAVGFETTAPANGMAVLQASQGGIRNFTVLVSHVLVPPAIRAILTAPHNVVQGFLAAGHVCTVMGTEEYEPLASEFHVPIVVTGFEPLDILLGIHDCILALESGRNMVLNRYSRAVCSAGNPHAKKVIREVFQVTPRKWRGIGVIPESGLGLAPDFREFDAGVRFGVADQTLEEPTECLSGLVLQGVRKPAECPAFGTICTPEHPLGATMVSSEGACAAYFRYRRT